MKSKKNFLTVAFCLAAGCFALGQSGVETRRSEAENVVDVVYVSGEVSASGDGSDAENAVKTFEEGYALLGEGGGVLVLCGDVTTTVTDNYYMAEKPVEITGAWEGVDYDPVWTVESTKDAKAHIQFTAATELSELTINRGKSIAETYTRCVELWSGPSLTVGEGMDFTNNGGALTEDSKGQLAVRLGHRDKAIDSAAYVQKSGTISFIHGGNNKNDVGASSIELSGNVKLLGMLQCGGTNKNVGSSTVKIGGNAQIGEMYVNGYGTANLGSSDITIGGESSVRSLAATRLDATVDGRITGDVGITIANDGAVENISFEGIEIVGNKNLTYSALDKTLRIDGDFGDWDNVTVCDDSEVHIAGTYVAPAVSLTVEDTSTLTLDACANPVLPVWTGNGTVSNAHDRGEGTLIGTGDKYGVQILMNLNDNATLQGTAVYGDHLFAATNYGECYVYSVSENKRIGYFKFGSYTDPNSTANEYWNHSNQMMFGGKKFAQEDRFPLLYITTGNSGDHDTDGSYISKCAVERISYDEASGVWSSQLVQTIQFNDSANIPDDDKDGVLTKTYNKADKKFYYADGNGYDAAKGYQKVGWGWAASFVDTDPTEETADKFYLFGARFRTTAAYEKNSKTDYGITDYYTDNAYIVTAFDLPDLPASEADFGEVVTLYPKDIVGQFETEYDIYFTQGGTMYQGRIYYSFGQYKPVGEKHVNGIRVFDIAAEKIVSRLDLSYDRNVTGTGEREPECCTFYEGKLVLSAKAKGSAVGNVLYLFDHLEFHVEQEAREGADGARYTVCGYCGERVSEIQTVHLMTKVEAKQAGVDEDGNIEHYRCSACGKLYADEEGKTELTAEEVVLSATGNSSAEEDGGDSSSEDDSADSSSDSEDNSSFVEEDNTSSEEGGADSSVEEENGDSSFEEKGLTFGISCGSGIAGGAVGGGALLVGAGRLFAEKKRWRK